MLQLANLPRAERNRLLLHALLYALIGIALAYRVWLIYAFNPMDHIWSDPQRHWEQGTDFTRDDPISLMDPILFQVYVGAMAKLSLGLPKLVAFYTSLLSVSMTWLWYRFMRELLPTKGWALFGWALVAWLPSWSAIYSYFMQETLMLTLLGGAMWATWRCRRRPTLATFMTAAIIWTAAGLTRSICLPLGLLVLSWLWLVQGDKLRRLGMSAVFLALAMGPLVYRSLERAHVVAPYGMGQLNALYARSGAFEIKVNYQRDGAIWHYGFGSPSVGLKPFEPFSEWSTARHGVAIYSINMNNGEADWDTAKANLDFTLSKYVWLARESLVFLFFAESWPDTDRTRDIGEINYQLRWLWAPLTLVCIVGTLVLWRRQRERMLPAMMLLWLIVQGLTLVSVNEGRYRKPFEGLLIAQSLLLASTLRSRKNAASDEQTIPVPVTAPLVDTPRQEPQA